MDELEDALRARWDRDTLLVYADALQAQGDPRGELIALDVEAAERAITPELALRRRRLLYEWLGGSTIHDRPIHEASFRYGFVTDFFATRHNKCSPADLVRGLLKSPAGPFVRGLTLDVATEGELRDALHHLIYAARPWLERLEIRAKTPASGIDIHALIRQTPRLHTLAVYGAPVLREFPHGAVRHVCIDRNGLALLGTIPHVQSLDLALDDTDAEDIDAIDAVSIASTIGALPDLVHVDLSRNEPQFTSPPEDNYTQPAAVTTDMLAFARVLPVQQLRTLRMPSIRTAQHARDLRTLVDRAPHLEVIVVRAYAAHDALLATLEHPQIHLPAPFAWPPVSTLSSREALTITVPTEEHGDDVSLSQLVDHLEAQWDDLPPNARDAWTRFWAFLADLPWEDAKGQPVVRMFPAATLLTAVEPLDDFVPYSGTPGLWAQLAEKLRAAELPPGTNVSVRRYWGW